MFKHLFRFGLCIAPLVVHLRAEDADDEREKAAQAATADAKVAGIVAGTVTSDGKQPVEFVAVSLKKADGTVVQSTVSDKQGRFSFAAVPAGSYTVAYGQVGADSQATPAFAVDAHHPRTDLPDLKLGGEVLQLEKMQVQSTQQKFLNSIDRKVYNVGKEIQSTAGSAGDLLQNVPSVDVDIDGNVSLRGSDNVLILINGRTSALMGRSRAEVLQQLPASEIDKIEVITNPSAKYKPDGTSGIINIALKKKHDSGLSGTVNASAGDRNRYNGGVSLNYHPGAWNFFGSGSLRLDDRPRVASDIRTITDPVTGAVTHAEKHTTEESRPLTRIARAGADYAPDADNQFGVAASYNRRTFHRHATDRNLVTTGTGAVSSDYDRTRDDPEYEQDIEVSGNYRHTFGEDHELNIEWRSSRTAEQEDNHYVDHFRTPAQADTADNMLIKNTVHSDEAKVDYTRPWGEDGRLEAGYNLDDERYGAIFRGEFLDPVSGRFVLDTTKTNSFNYDRAVHAFYTTYARTFGAFGFMAGLRPELTYGKSYSPTTGATGHNDYTRVYPTLHLSDHLTDRHELQLNYSHRVRRPEIDDLNPFPEYADPFTLRAGNPNLRPEDIHSIEAGYSYHNGDTTFTSTVYDRRTYHGFTNFTTDLGGGVLLTTHANLATSNAAGLEVTANTDFGKLASLNFSSNTFYNTIDASNLGFSASKSDVSWLAKLGVTLHLPRDTQVQFNTNYSSARLTPQGERRPTWVANLGARHDFAKKKAAVVLTVSDLFNSLKETNVLDTPLLKETVMRRRSSRIVYLGFIYNFGAPAKKNKDDSLKFDNSL
ncbi:MAG TPA: TonB-dependent receptor [Lacunisphaera sp.]